MRHRRREAIDDLDAVRAALQQHIDELRRFEHEYHVGLKAYLGGQLLVLEARAGDARQVP